MAIIYTPISIFTNAKSKKTEKYLQLCLVKVNATPKKILIAFNLTNRRVAFNLTVIASSDENGSPNSSESELAVQLYLLFSKVELFYYS